MKYLATSRPNINFTLRECNDQSNQINNALVFVGMFRGTLDVMTSQNDRAMKLVAAETIAGGDRSAKLNENYIFHGAFICRVARPGASGMAAIDFRFGVAPG